jgi:hypothetical protein
MRPDGLLLLNEPLPKDPRVVADDGRSSLRQSWLPFPCGAALGARRSAGVFTRPDGLLEEPLPNDPRVVGADGRSILRQS